MHEFASKPPEEMGDEWGLFLKELGLTHGYYLAVCEVLKQGRWATAKHPTAYVKKAALTEARKMHLVERPENDTLECRDRHLVFVGDFGEPDPEDRKGISELELRTNRFAERAQFMADALYCARVEAKTREEDKPSFPAKLMSWQEPRWWQIAGTPEGTRPLAYRTLDGFHYGVTGPRANLQKSEFRCDWEKWAQEAGLDSWELKVALYRRDGVSRDSALAQQPDEHSYLALQAAWRSFDRTGKKRFRDSVRKMQMNCPR